MGAFTGVSVSSESSLSDTLSVFGFSEPTAVVTLPFACPLRGSRTGAAGACHGEVGAGLSECDEELVQELGRNIADFQVFDGSQEGDLHDQCN